MKLLRRLAIGVAVVGMISSSAGVAAAKGSETKRPEPWALNPPVSTKYVLADSPEEAVKVKKGLADGSLSAAAVTFGPCELIMSNVYLRTSSSSLPFGGVGFKPTTKCSTPVTSIAHLSELWYEDWIWWYPANLYPGAGNLGQSTYEQKNISYPCVDNADDTLWQGFTTGTIVYNGRTYYATNYTPIADLACEGP